MPVNFPCLISVGEYSGDILAAEFITALCAQGIRWEWLGIAGENMRELGVKALATPEDLSVMGFWDVFKKLTQLRIIQKRLLLEVERRNIKLAVLVDYPGFHFQLAKALKIRGVTVIQFVAPKLWAWGEGRITRLRRDFDLVLGVLPFESDFFCSRGVPYKYIGTPHKDRVKNISKNRADLGFSENIPLLACLPGSRNSEILKIAEVMNEILAKLLLKIPDLQIGIPVPANLSIELLQKNFALVAKGKIKLLQGNSLKLMACADAALLTSGTATLECGLLHTPMVVVYRMDSLSYFLAKIKVKVPWISLVNLIMQKKVVSEHIQDIDSEILEAELMDLLTKDSVNYKKIKSDLQEMSGLLQDKAGEKAAKEIIAFSKRIFSD